MKKHIILCADDYGQAVPISQGILSLLDQTRLSAVSALVTGPDWTTQAKWLAPYHDQADLGLHFNVTEGQPLSPAFAKAFGQILPSLSQLLCCLFFTRRRYQQSMVDAIEAEWHAQFDQFIAGMGRPPRFIDGHQHVHQFPLIRDALITFYQKRCKQYKHKIYVRSVCPTLRGYGLFCNRKKTIITLTGTKPLQHLLLQHNIAHNRSFAGIYDFATKKDYRHYFLRFLTEVNNRGIIMCHPAYLATNVSLAAARLREYLYFASPLFLDDCMAQHVTLTRFQLTPTKNARSFTAWSN